jgi:hypothetical protein
MAFSVTSKEQTWRIVVGDRANEQPASQNPGSRAVSLWRMVLSFEQQATRAELVPDDEGWYVIFSSGRARRSWPQFVSRSAVVETIFDLQGDTVARVVAYFEQCLRDLGYEPVRKASKMSHDLLPGPPSEQLRWQIPDGLHPPRPR